VPRPSHRLWFYHPNNIWLSVQVMKLIGIMKSSPASCHFFPLRSKYSQHPVLKPPQFVFFPYCENSSFTPIQNNR
jgi:hypothetical protein